MKKVTEKSRREAVLRALVYIQRHLDDDLSLAGLAAAAHFSPYHFHRIFRETTGEAPMEHIRRLRLERSAFRLKTSTRPVTDIALAAGYRTHEAFTRAFATRYGRPPAEFRSDPASLSYVPVLDAPPPLPKGHFPAAPSGVAAELLIRVERVRPLRVAFIRNMGAYGWVAWQRLLPFARERRLFRRGTRLVGIRHDCTDLTPRDRVRYDAGITVSAAFQPEGEIGVQEVGGGEYLIATFFGDYGERFAACDRLCNRWIPEAGRTLRADPVFEIYRRSAREAPPLTTIYLPLEPVGR